MKIKITLFASAKELAGANDLEVDLPDRANVKELKLAMLEKHPELTDLVAKSVFSVDHAFANEQHVLNENAEIALIPPVSGG